MNPSPAIEAEHSSASSWQLMWARHTSLTFALVSEFFHERGNAAVTDAIIDALLLNQDDIGNAVGGVLGKELSTRLRDYVTGVGAVLRAMTFNDSAALESAELAWDRTGIDISQTIAKMAQRGLVDDLRRQNSVFVLLIRPHLNKTAEYAAAYCAGEYAQAIALYAHALEHAVSVIGGAFERIGAPISDKYRQMLHDLRANRP